MWLLERRFDLNLSDLRFLFPIIPLILNESTHTKKNQYVCTGFFYSDFLSINRLSGERKKINMVAAHKHLLMSYNQKQHSH